MSVEWAVECEAVGKVYAGYSEMPALAGVDLRIARGEFACLSGPSGSGKTTLLNLIGGLDAPSSGRLVVAGEAIEELSGVELAA
ncbi:MAG: ATP-binding cassette domain-containing protein, partial [Gammaproteobacteria bacterium]